MYFFFVLLCILISPTGGGRSVGIVRVQTKATEFSLVMYSYCSAVYSYWYVYIFLLLCMFCSGYSVSLCCSVYCL